MIPSAKYNGNVANPVHKVFSFVEFCLDSSESGSLFYDTQNSVSVDQGVHYASIPEQTFGPAAIALGTDER